MLAEHLRNAETALAWDLALALPQVLGASNGMRALYGLERLAVVHGGEWRYPQHDAIGSVRQWTDAAGAVVGLQGYTPYGESLVPLGPSVAPWGFTGEWQDPAGLVYLRARWYHGGLGRFTQVDPLPGVRSDPMTRHAYLYAGNSPLVYRDPTGRSWWALGAALVAGAVDYGFQVHRNVQRGMDLRRAMTTDINVREVLSVAGAAGIAVLSFPAVLSVAGAGLSAGGWGLSAIALRLGMTAALPTTLAVWRAGTWSFGAANAAAVAIYGLRTCPSSEAGVGRYKAVGGHHVHAKSTFEGDPSYHPDEALSISHNYMSQRGWRHSEITAAQRTLFKQLSESGSSNTLEEHTRIAVEALMAAGATREEAERLAAQSLENLRVQGVGDPIRIPWYHGKPGIE